MTNIVKANGKYYCIDTCRLKPPMCNTYHEEVWESMVFRCKRNGTILNAHEVYSRHYYRKEEAERGHKELTVNLANYI